MIIKNRFGRLVDVSEEQARQMIAHKEGEPVIQEPEKKEVNPLQCPYCGRVCKNKVGFNSHVRACKKKVL